MSVAQKAMVFCFRISVNDRVVSKSDIGSYRPVSGTHFSFTFHVPSYLQRFRQVAKVSSEKLVVVPSDFPAEYAGLLSAPCIGENSHILLASFGCTLWHPPAVLDSCDSPQGLESWRCSGAEWRLHACGAGVGATGPCEGNRYCERGATDNRGRRGNTHSQRP
jgi:hypothetical protein